jgi:hypothetical protein
MTGQNFVTPLVFPVSGNLDECGSDFILWIAYAPGCRKARRRDSLNGSTIAAKQPVGSKDELSRVENQLLKEKRMSTHTITTVLLIVALAFLGLYLLRRRGRKDSSK